MKATIKVTQDDINVGIPDDARMCPIAHAMRRAGFIRIRVFGHFVMFRVERSDGEHFYTDRLPDSASKFVNDFDNRRVVYPFEFEFEYA